MNSRVEYNDMPPDIRQRRRNGCNWASAITAFCRGTGLTELACYRVLPTAMDASAGREEFRMSFVQFGRRMARGESKSDEAYAEMTSRDLAILEKAQARTGYYPLIVVRGDKKKKTVSEWRFPGLQWIEQIHSRAIKILDRERPKGRTGMNREACFDAAFAEIEESIPRKEPNVLKPIPKDPRSKRLALIGSIGGIAKRLRIDALNNGADEKEIANLREAINRQVDRAFDLPSDMLRVAPKKNTAPSDHPIPPPPSVVKKGGTQPDDQRTPEAGRKGDKTVGASLAKIQQKQASHGDSRDKLKPDPSTARVALDYLLSVGVHNFAFFFRDDKAPRDECIHDRRELDGDTLKRCFEALLEEASSRQHSLVVDMRLGGARIIQVDDCNESILSLLAPISVLQILTSDGNGQAIIALSPGLSDEECEATKKRLFATLKGSGANRGASGASRWPGSFNFKPNRQRADGSFPMVRLLGGLFGRSVTTQELEGTGLLAPSEATKPLRLQLRRPPSPENLYWPEYDVKLSATDRSRADFKFCAAAVEIGYPSQAIEEKLLEVSPKALQRSPNYAEMTVRKALDVVEHRRVRGT
jgi:hypothetical protein